MGPQAEAFRAALGVWEGSPMGPQDQQQEHPPSTGGKGAGGLRAELDARLGPPPRPGSAGGGREHSDDSRKRFADAELGFATPRKGEGEGGASSPQLSFSVLENGTPPASLYGTQGHDS
eukprot:174794-Rhodomonas_salina.1